MYSSRMPVPAWDSYSCEPQDTATVVSDDIWKKFDLDDLASYQHSDLMEDPLSAASSPLPQQYNEVPMMMNFDRLNCQATSEIRHHDCMWAGLCISKEHNRSHAVKKDPKIQRRVPAGRSLLIPKNLQQQQAQQQAQQQQQQQRQQASLLQRNHAGAQSNGPACRPSASSMTTKNLESDGDSTRPETPQSSDESETESEEDEEEEDEEEYEPPVFKHEQINITDIVSASEVTGQHIQRKSAVYDRRKEEQAKIRNTLMSDHCYHLSQQQPSNKAKSLDHLGVQTPSDSEEEIDVVSWDKPTRPASTVTLPTQPSPTEHQRIQYTVNTALNRKRRRGSIKQSQIEEEQQQQQQQQQQQPLPATPSPPPTPRPRGRPPSNSTVASRKRAAAAAALEQAKANPVATGNKRAKQGTGTTRAYNRRKPAGAACPASPAGPSNKSSPQTSPRKNNTRTNSSDEEEPDTEKRSLHNNMERQRRIELRGAFEELRRLVPEVEAKDKAPKVAILRQAAAYCDKLIDQEHLNLSWIVELRKQQDRLKAQLGHLRRSLAMRR